MTHILAILGLGVACVLWFLVQRWAEAGRGAAAASGAPAASGCGTCTACDAPSRPADDPACPPAATEAARDRRARSAPGGAPASR